MTSRRFSTGGRMEMTASAVFLLPLVFIGLAVTIITVTGVSLISIGVGVPMVFAMVLFTRHFADLHRYWLASRFGVAIDRPYRDLPDEPGFIGFWKRFQGLVTDPQTWRDQAWLWVNMVLGLAFLVTVIALFAAGLGSISMGLWWHLMPEGAEYTSLFYTVSDTPTAFLYGIPAGLAYLTAWWLATPPLMRAYTHLAVVFLGERQPTLAERIDRLTRAAG
ncbi:hypothetical protein Afil01_60640 [Actinorhabdospora filicis]|uniref:Putative sensor domain-containing protein n=1 Tax=Actinorhabdospora filicis TaxID=1785913 RepID=A0A9W6SSY0_9ACTN|nr:sensor domain-containing protein [Actinorhabdospora filicis]GLZ81257.1 hypothetical protein Afil01_60640 [Actinorhabdospora filicis]